MSTSTELLKRKAEISTMSLHAVVKGKDAVEGNWKEVADIASVSATGSGLYLQRECRVGTLLSLMLPLEPHLRCHDHEKELYRVWGLVQHCQPLSGDGGSGFHVGVAFIGKDAPVSYKENPDQPYKICGMNENGLWKVTEAKAQFKVRRHVRYWVNVDPYLALVDGHRDALRGERTLTENISNFSGLAVVCNRQTGKDGRERLNLQFVENTFPVEKLEKVKEQKVSVV
jgi:hypothetical protein